MKYKNKTKDQLIKELTKLRHKIKELESRESAYKKMGEKLQKNEQNLKTILKSVHDVIYQLSPTGVILYVSPNVEKLYGYKPEELIGKHFKLTTPMSEILKAIKVIKKVISGKTVRDFEIKQVDKNGKIFFMEINSTPVKKGNRIVAVQGVMRDITRRKKIEVDFKK